MKKIFLSRYGLLLSTIIIYIITSFLIRLTFSIISFHNLDGHVYNMLCTFAIGLCYDITVALFITTFYNVYLLLFPTCFIGSIADRILTFFILIVTLFITYFGSVAEFPFWDEFGSRFNFIAVDYLIYTYEVIENIKESYPLPLLIGGLLLLVLLTLFLLNKKKISSAAFTNKMPFKKRLVVSSALLATTALLGIFLTNKNAEFSKNTTVNELSKNGIFSFFAAFRSNELDYDAFYLTLSQRDAYTILKKELVQENQEYVSTDFDAISRITKGNGQPVQYPNIILVTIESFSAEFLSAFGNKKNITPNYDSMANESIFFKNMYATGTRTVRGMEALALSVPPTPGNSIVRRPNNKNIYSIGTVLKEKGYQLNFIYGGDGYFDNMNTFFGGQGFDIIDRDRGNPLSDNIDTQRFPIQDNEVSFENAWGICDEDIYKQSIKNADSEFQQNKPFFQFIMTSSNHKPYTFPNGKIDLPQGNRDGAVKYTDYALGKFINQAKTKPWFKNTVFVIVADHCASSAGKWEINIEKHRIPAIIYNLNHQHTQIDRLVSQIDLMPTLLGYLNWNYQSSFYGKDINQTKIGDERAFIGNYRTLGLLKGNVFTQLNDKKRVTQFRWNERSKTMSEVKDTNNRFLITQTIACYQTASERFKKGRMKEKQH